MPSLIFAMYCLAKNPDAQQKVYEEIRGVLNADEPITGDHINRLTYLKACVKESQRWVTYNLWPHFVRLAWLSLYSHSYICFCLIDHLLLQWNLCNLTDTGRGERNFVSIYRQGVQLHSGKNIENGQMEININQNRVKQWNGLISGWINQVWD